MPVGELVTQCLCVMTRNDNLFGEKMQIAAMKGCIWSATVFQPAA